MKKTPRNMTRPARKADTTIRMWDVRVVNVRLRFGAVPPCVKKHAIPAGAHHFEKHRRPVIGPKRQRGGDHGPRGQGYSISGRDAGDTMAGISYPLEWNPIQIGLIKAVRNAQSVLPQVFRPLTIFTSISPGFSSISGLR